MKWLKEAVIELAKKVSPLHAFILLLTGIVCVTGYYMYDRYWDYRQAVDLSKPKVAIRNENTMKDMGIKYSEITKSYSDNRVGVVGQAK